MNWMDSTARYSHMEDQLGSGETAKNNQKQQSPNISNDHAQSDGHTSSAVPLVRSSDGGTKNVTSILEAGAILFFIRGRVGIDMPDNIDSISRTYIVLRPIAQLGRSLQDYVGSTSTSRVLILPKKRLPRKGERFMVFVNKANESENDIKADLSASPEYATKGSGLHYVPAAKQVGRGIYTITTAQGATRLTYMITPSSELVDSRKLIGLVDHGSFIMFTKNPTYQGPVNTQVSSGPNFSEEIWKEFRCLRWVPSKPAHLEYANAQLLLIGTRTIVKGSQEEEIDSVGEAIFD
ncbi:hypothetical protein BGZ63DRAFT_423326 [Mariannaea sp. PMI_226]|nr:hypothetical protein BGZ63DRAFT_423326 [Mariannaea sp. PMI_226]